MYWSEGGVKGGFSYAESGIQFVEYKLPMCCVVNKNCAHKRTQAFPLAIKESVFRECFGVDKLVQKEAEKVT